MNKPAPILNTPHFKAVYGTALPFDGQYLVRALEYIAFPNQTFTILSENENHILQVSTPEYPSETPLYVDARFGHTHSETINPPKNSMPSKAVLVERLLSKVGLPYVWGGNWSKGIAEWDLLYPPPKNLSPMETAHWTFRGLDCSGLLYEATGGLTPRNTSEMLTYGFEIPTRGLKPLDLVFHPGHVLIVISPDEVIESSLHLGGVVVSPLQERLDQIKDPLMSRRFFQISQDTA